MNPLFSAVRSNDSKRVTRFAKAGAPIDKRDEGGWTPLIVSIAEAKYEAFEALLASGASLDIRDNSGLTALDYARLFGDSFILKQLERELAKGGQD